MDCVCYEVEDMEHELGVIHGILKDELRIPVLSLVLVQYLVFISTVTLNEQAYREEYQNHNDCTIDIVTT